MARGFYKMHRGWMENRAFGREPFTRAQAWCWLIEHAAWKPRRQPVGSLVVEVSTGQLAVSMRYLAQAWMWSEPKVRRFVGRLQTDAMIDAVSDAGKTVISICNYAKYQIADAPSDAPSDAASGEPATHQRRTSDANYKKGKELKEGEEEGSTSRSNDLDAAAPSPSVDPAGQYQSAEEMFWALKPKAASVGITPSLMGKLANQADDFDDAYDTLTAAIQKKEPRKYLAAVLGKRKTEDRNEMAALTGRPSSEPQFVQAARRDGHHIERLESGNWRVGGMIYDAQGNDVGW